MGYHKDTFTTVKLKLLQQPQQKAGLLQPPVPRVSQPQPARRLDPPSRLSGRNDRGDQVPNRKDDRSREREREKDVDPEKDLLRENVPREISSERERMVTLESLTCCPTLHSSLFKVFFRLS